MRGEKNMGIVNAIFAPGSPPRARGEGHEAADLRPVDGITPACAGRSNTAIVSHKNGQDHPRVRGEKDPSRWAKK